MEIDLTLARNYTVQTGVWLPSVPGTMPVYYYPGASTAGGQDGILLEVVSNAGSAWLGMFARGPHSLLDGLYSYPDGQTLCVVSSGKCYFVRTDAPEQWRERAEVIRMVRLLPEHNMLLLGCVGYLIAYGAHGFLWTTDMSAFSDYTIERIDGNGLYGKAQRGYYGHSERWVDYAIHLVTGKPKGGLS